MIKMLIAIPLIKIKYLRFLIGSIGALLTIATFLLIMRSLFHTDESMFQIMVSYSTPIVLGSCIYKLDVGSQTEVTNINFSITIPIWFLV